MLVGRVRPFHRGMCAPVLVGHANMYPWKHVPLDFEQGNSEYFMMDWTRLVSDSLNIITKKLPRDCRLRGYMFASLNFGAGAGGGLASSLGRSIAGASP